MYLQGCLEMDILLLYLKDVLKFEQKIEKVTQIRWYIK